MKTARSMFSSERGFSLMEIMVTVGVLSIVALGTSVLFSDMFAIQKRGDTVQRIQQMRTEIIDAVTKSRTNSGAGFESAWLATVDDSIANPFLACVKNNTACAKDTAVRLNIKRVDGTELFYSRTAARGFRMDGQLCSTFSAVSGDPNCPFSWNINVLARCIGTDKPSCTNPIIEVDGRLQYSPGSNNVMGAPFNVEPYAFNVRRGDKPDLNQPFVISYVENDNSGETGSCFGSGPNWPRRRLNTIVSDPAGNVTALGTDTFTLRLGSYDCRIQAPAFKNGTNRIRLSATVGALSGVINTSSPATASLNGGSATVTLQTTFTISVPTTFAIEHRCDQQPTSAPNPSPNNDYILGVPARGINPITSLVDYSGVTYTIVSCIKTS